MGFLRLLLLCSAWLISTPANAQSLPVEVQRADTWLRAQVNAAGDIAGANTAIANPNQTLGEVSRALGLTGQVPLTLINRLEAITERNTEYLSRALIVKARAGQNTTALVQSLKQSQNVDGGFSASSGYASTLIDTAWVLAALSEAGAVPDPTTAKACARLIAKQNADGSFGDAALIRKPMLTGFVLESLFRYAGAHPNAQALSKGNTWLMSQLASTDMLALAHTLISLRIANPDSSVLSAGLARLKTAQLTNGSFENDPYLTAVAIRALLAANDAPPPPTKGSLSIKLVRTGSTAAISGASVAITLGASTGAFSRTVLTDESGAARFTELDPGTYAVALSKAGYIGKSTTAAIIAGQNTDLATTDLTLLPTGSGLRGLVRDGATQTALAGVTISLSGAITATAQTDAAGRYELSGLGTGSTVVSLSKTGYQPISQTIVFTQNTNFDFSPALYATGNPPPTLASVKARILSASTGAPILSAALQLGAQTVLTDAEGRASFTSMQPIATQGSVAVAGYEGVQFSLVLSPGVNDIGDIRLTPSTLPTTLTLQGKVTAATGGAAIAGAQIIIQGSGLNAISGADGRYQIASIGTLSLSMSVTAPGYLSRSFTFNASRFGTATLDLELAAIVAAVSFEPVVTNQPSYGALAEMMIGSELRNENSAPRQVTVQLVMTDAQGQVIGQAGYIVPGPDLNSVVTVPANGRAPIQIAWYTNTMPPGSYFATLKAYAAAGGALVAERSTGFQINPTLSVGGQIDLSPPITFCKQR